MTWNPDAVRVAVHRDLREIVRLYALLPDEAEAQALGRDAGGLDALNLAAPAANLEAWENRYEAAEREGRDTEYAADQTAELHPLLVLATWEDAVRDELGQPTDLKATVERAADYLSRSLDWMLGTDEWGNLNFLGVDALANDLKKCRRMLEDVTNEGNRLTRIKTRCIWCDDAPCLAVAEDEHRAALDGVWRCPSCRTMYDEAGVAAAARHALAVGDGWVHGPDAAAILGRSIKSIRTWDADGRLQRRMQGGNVQYLWSEVRALHNETPQRQRVSDTA